MTILKVVSHTDSPPVCLLIGFISFDQNGRRTNFSLDVMEMNTRSELVQIGKWSDQVKHNILFTSLGIEAKS